MDKDTIQGLVRFALMVLAGYLLFGWRGAVAFPIVTGVLTGLVTDHVECMVKIAKGMGMQR